MKFVILVAAVAVLIPQAGLAQERSRVEVSAEAATGVMSYYFGEDPYPLAAAAAAVTLHGFARVYVEATRVWARETVSCPGSCAGPKTAPAPLSYGNLGAQFILPLKVVRPYIGADVGRLNTCGPRAITQTPEGTFTSGGRCASTSLEAGTRIRVGSRMEGKLGVRRRADDRFETRQTSATEFRIGVGYVVW